MRLRNKPWVKDYLKSNEEYLIKWTNHDDYLKLERIYANANPIHLEIGCGKGNFISQKALQNPDINYIGMEKETTVVGVALKKTISLFKINQKQCNNLKYFNYFAEDLSKIFAPKSIDRIYLNFSDPWPKAKHAKKRLMHHDFLDIYALILKPNGLIEFKTDNDSLFEFAVSEVLDSLHWKILQQTTDLYNDPLMLKGNTQTEYEIKFHESGKNINKLVIINQT